MGFTLRFITSIQEEERTKINNIESDIENNFEPNNNIEEVKDDGKISSGDLFDLFIGID
jgi:hypothetical protein